MDRIALLIRPGRGLATTIMPSDVHRKAFDDKADKQYGTHGNSQTGKEYLRPTGKPHTTNTPRPTVKNTGTENRRTHTQRSLTRFRTGVAYHQPRSSTPHFRKYSRNRRATLNWPIPFKTIYATNVPHRTVPTKETVHEPENKPRLTPTCDKSSAFFRNTPIKK